MKNKILTLICVAMVITTSFEANADEYNLKFTGKITDETCDVEASSAEQTVHLGEFTTAEFSGKDSTSKAKGFSINLKNCTQSSGGTKVWFSGTSDTDNAALLALSPTGTETTILATGVGVELLDQDMVPIAINNTTSTIYPLKAGDNTLSFNLRYKATKSAITGGNATAVMYFDMDYQ